MKLVVLHTLRGSLYYMQICTLIKMAGINQWFLVLIPKYQVYFSQKMCINLKETLCILLSNEIKL